MKKSLFFLLMGLFLFGRVSAEIDEPRIRAELDRSRITIGDRLTLTLAVDAPGGYHVLFPEFKDRLGDLEIKGIGKETVKRLEGERMRHTLGIILTSYSVGSFAIPILSAKVVSPDGEEISLETLQLFVEVASVIPEGDLLEDIRDIKGVIGLPGLWMSPWVLCAIFLVLFLLGGFLLQGIRSRRRRSVLPLSPPAHQLALEALDRLDQEALWERDVKEYHVQVSVILRRYLEHRFGMRAPEETTEEFLESVSKNHILNEAQKKCLESFLEQCDLVKFAKFTPAAQEARRVSHVARGFIQQTKPEETGPAGDL